MTIVMKMTESTVEAAALEWLGGLGFDTVHGLAIAPGEPLAERASFGEVLLERRLRDAVAELNADVPEEAREDAVRRVLRIEGVSTLERNRRLHSYLAHGV